ncbi:MAG TPA: amino acid permease [Candidatus Nitrosotenuis sp.]|nr:amino acid permease [Candidatus Nitrosotenuis sp.]
MSELKRNLGLFQTTMYGVGLILGAGIYALIGNATGEAGNSVWISFILAAVASVFTGLSYAELSSMYPKAAAEYSFIKNAFKNNFIAFIVGWLTLFVAIISASTIAVAFGGYFASLFGAPVLISAILAIAALSFVNFFGIKESSSMNIIFTVIEASGLALIVWIGFGLFGNSDVNYFEAPNGFAGVFSAFTLVFFAYIGFENIANIAEEIRHPRKVLPRAIILSISITAIFYILVATATVRVLDWQELGSSIAPLADVVKKALGPQAQMILSMIALFATTNTILIMLISGSRILYGIAKDRSLPKIFSIVHHARKTPWPAVLIIGSLAVVFTFLGDLSTIANISVFTIIMVFVLVNIAIIWLRIKEPDIERPFRVPLSVKKVPILPVLGIITPILGVIQLDLEVIVIGFGVVGAGIVFYFGYNKLSHPSKI